MLWFIDIQDIDYELAFKRIPCDKKKFKILDLTQLTFQRNMHSKYLLTI